MPSFGRIRLGDWRQFDDVDIAFHPRMTILTGANGAGKTTLLKLLAVHCGWSFKYASTPTVSKRGLQYLSGAWSQLGLRTDGESPGHKIGEIVYDDNTCNILSVPHTPGPTFNIHIATQHPIPGVYIASHRPVFIYQSVEHIPTKINPLFEIFKTYTAELKTRLNPTSKQNSPTFRMKEAIISSAVLGYGNRYVDSNHEAIAMFEGFQAVLQKVLPPAVGFREINIRMPDVVFVTESGEFVIDEASGGLASIIDLAWQIFLASRIYWKGFVVLIDEPENHLHPKMQLSLLSDFVGAFPSAQFIVATHSPLIVSSVKESTVYVLDFADTKEGARRVRSYKLDLETKSGTANEILREVLGLETSMPIWAQREMSNLIERYASKDLSREQLEQLRDEMKGLGLDEMIPDLIVKG
jgi:energy-coupling factor transporter ATP-binding protein EcfA2